MGFDHTQKCTFQLENDLGNLEVIGEIRGDSDIPFYDDLKFKAAISLLNSIDKKNFSESGNVSLFHHFMNEIEDTIQAMKQYDRFQGEIKEFE
ncbi:hypothetical protein HPT25_20715 [Bacillus sp. BRMEA1]|uniref:hypothetical protein n=1 Tax=Neobacillus endophyticus TaxID=2738405 RepID=UPI0015631975|nr:hypothetical protein [Neobacillus endophyticus]NRD79763.1 hypothetical protein [Neobacillus endophyticus]